MGFQHSALNGAAGELHDLREASAKVGGLDPIEELRDIDCQPDEIRDSAAKVDAGAEQEHQAGRTYADATRSADDNWDGPAAQAYLNNAIDLGVTRRARQQAAEDTATAGQRIADGLDALARSAADQATAIAGEAAPAVQMVLHPPTLTGGTPVTDPMRQQMQQRMEQAAARVRQACTDIREAVQRNVNQIDDLGDSLEGLTEPIQAAD